MLSIEGFIIFWDLSTRSAGGGGVTSRVPLSLQASGASRRRR